MNECILYRGWWSPQDEHLRYESEDLEEFGVLLALATGLELPITLPGAVNFDPPNVVNPIGTQVTIQRFNPGHWLGALINWQPIAHNDRLITGLYLEVVGILQGEQLTMTCRHPTRVVLNDVFGGGHHDHNVFDGGHHDFQVTPRRMLGISTIGVNNIFNVRSGLPLHLFREGLDLHAEYQVDEIMQFEPYPALVLLSPQNSFLVDMVVVNKLERNENEYFTLEFSIGRLLNIEMNPIADAARTAITTQGRVFRVLYGCRSGVIEFSFHPYEA